MNKINYLEPIDIDERNKDYLGTFSISDSHLPLIFPKYKDAELLGEFWELKRRGSEDPNYFGMMNYKGANILIGILRALQPNSIFEIGTAYGLMTKYMAQAAPNAEIHTLDIGTQDYDSAKYIVDGWNKDYRSKDNSDVGRAYRDAGLEKRIIQHIGDSGTFDFSPYYGKIDFVLVDADHGYYGAKHDLEEAFEMVNQGGLVVVDDYGKLHHNEGIVLAVLEAVKDGRDFYFVNHNDGPKTELVFHPNIPKAIHKPHFNNRTNYRECLIETADVEHF